MDTAGKRVGLQVLGANRAQPARSDRTHWERRALRPVLLHGTELSLQPERRQCKIDFVKVVTGTVIGGKIIVESEPLTDGSKVTVI
jgi:hypothetical protein